MKSLLLLAALLAGGDGDADAAFVRGQRLEEALGDMEGALAAFRAAASSAEPGRRAAAVLREAGVLRRLGRDGDARAALEGLLADGPAAEVPGAREGAERILSRLGTGEPSPDPPELKALRSNFAGYGLGFGLRDYRGYKLVSHTGGLPGFVSCIAMIPELKLGVAVFTNQESEEAYMSLSCHVLDYYIGGDATDWVGGFANLRARNDSLLAVRELRTISERDSLSRPSLPLVKYAGVYKDVWYGTVSIAKVGKGLVMQFSHSPGMVGDLEHWQHDTFVVRWRDRELRADAFVTFALTAEGAIDRATMKAVSPATDFSFDFQDLLLKPAPARGK